jgi:exonuclease III
MARLRIMSLNGEDMAVLIPASLEIPKTDRFTYWRASLLAQMIKEVDPDIIGLVEAPTSSARTEKFVEGFLGNGYRVHQAEKRGTLGLAILVREGLGIKVKMRTKAQSKSDFKLDTFDADGDGIKESYSWFNRVPMEAKISAGGISAPVTLILVHAKSKGAFIPGDLFAYERLSRANRMKQRAQADAIRKRLGKLIDDAGQGRVIVMGDMNDGPEFDVYAALLGGAFLEPLMGSIWDPTRILYNPHTSIPVKDRWTIDYLDRVVNPLGASKYGQPSEMRSWIDHILVSPELKGSVISGTAAILHRQPKPAGIPQKWARSRGTDHHPPYLDLQL